MLWVGMFGRDRKEALAAQGQLALQIARSLKVPLDATTMAGSGTKSLQAWQLFLKAQRMPGGKPEPLLRQALALVLMDQALLLQTDSHPALIEMGMIPFALGRREEALALARRFDWLKIIGLEGSSEGLATMRQHSGLREHQTAALASFEGPYDACFDRFEKDHSEFANPAPG